ncbi:unnamed protein product [Symbiodinium sp. CCMP2456]|nr:unnamed protein product [Symbiodinium sp. CCMP2456]
MVRIRSIVIACILHISAAAAEDGSCSADNAAAGSCIMDEASKIEEDMARLCPLLRAGSAFYAFTGRFLSRTTGTMSMASLWPRGVHPELFADEYTVSVLTIVGRILLGLYKTRDKSYVNIPTAMLDHDEVLDVENIHAPLYDVDGSPNFYWFEAIFPQFILRRLYVPLMTCFYSGLRKMNTDAEGNMDDALDDPAYNTWEAVLKNSNMSKRDWVLSFYDIAHTWDGNPLWPKQMTDFSVYFKKDEWEDQLERAIAFHLIGTHRLEAGSFSVDVPGIGSMKLPYRIALNVFSDLSVRDGFGRYGVDLYFNEDELPVLLVTPDNHTVARGDKQWQYWKFVWRSTLITGITLVDHLHFTHFRTASLLSRAIRIKLPSDHPQRRLMSIFTFGSIFVNIQATHVLLGTNHLLHRATPFSHFLKLSHKVPKMLDDVTDAPSIQAIVEDAVWNEKLSPKLRSLPYYADGRLLWETIKKFITDIFQRSNVCTEEDALQPAMANFGKELLAETIEEPRRSGHARRVSCFMTVAWMNDCCDAESTRT